MSRKGPIPKRKTAPDPKYGDVAVAKLVNGIMKHGKKSQAQKIVYTAFDIVKEKLSLDALDVFKQAMENIMPVVETKGRRRGGSIYQVPVEVRPERRQTLGVRMLVTYARKRSEHEIENKLANEIIDAYNKTGGAFKRKEEIHRTAEANKAFAHYNY